MSFMMLVMIFVMPPELVSAKRITEVLDTEPTIIDGHMTEGTPGKKGEVAFANVSFCYPGASDYVLQDITFTAKEGETVAFIGSTGSGKSTLISLIPRFFDATEGSILVDGVDVKTYTQEALHNKIGCVPQKAVMFRGSVGSNVGYGDNGKVRPEFEDIKTAVRIAQGK